MSGSTLLRTLLYGRVQMIFLALLTYGAFYLLLAKIYEPTGRPVGRSWRIVEDTSRFDQTELSIPFYRIMDRPSSVRLRQTLKYAPGESLVFPRLSGNRLRVFVNGHTVGEVGGPSGTGNIWTAFHWMDLPEEEAGRDIVLELRLEGAYDLGIREVPYLLVARDHQLFRWGTSVVFSDLYWVVVGVILALSALQLYYARIDRRLRLPYWLNTAGVLLGALYLLDFAWRMDTGSLSFYLLARKTMLVCGYAAPWFMLAAMERYTYNRWRATYAGLLVTIVAALLVISAPSLVELKSRSVYAGALAQINWLCLFTIALAARQNRIVYAVAFFYVTLIGSLVAMISPNAHIFMLQIGYGFATGSVIFNMIEEFGRLHEDYQQAYRKSMVDPLTGALNRFALEEANVEAGDCVVLIDLNHFKEINDRYGHHAGDRVLVEWMRCAKLFTGKNHTIIRTGGDEFIILARGKEETKMDEMLAEFQKSLSDLTASFSYGSALVETTLQAAIQEADSRMYEHKKKSRVVWLRRFLRRNRSIAG